MSLTAEDLKAIRGIVIEELDARAERIGPLMASYVEAEVEKLRPAVVDGFKVASLELAATKDALSKAAAEESRETSRALGRIEGKIGPLGGRVGGVETRLTSIEDLLDKVYSAQGIDLQQGATIRRSLMPGEKPAVSETPPAFEGELAVESEQKTDASPPANERE